MYNLASHLGRAALDYYVPKRASRRAKPRRKRNNASRANVPQRPPTRSIMQGTFQGSLRQFYTVTTTSGYFEKNIVASSLLADAYASLGVAFFEIQVKAIRVYFTPSNAITSPGVYAACLIDGDSITSSPKIGYAQILGNPGSVSRRSYQSCGLHWKWTEPSDSEFRKTNDNSTITSFFLRLSKDDAPTLTGELTVDASVVLRSSGSLLGNPLVRLLREYPEIAVQDIEQISALVDALSLSSSLGGRRSPCEEDRPTSEGASSGQSFSRVDWASCLPDD